MTALAHALDEMRRLDRAGRIADALAVIAPVALALREGDDALAAIDATMNESILCGRLGDNDTALARATWALGTACDPRHRATFSPHAAAWRVTMAFYAWCNAARGHAAISYDAIGAVVGQAESFLAAVGRTHWRSGVLAEHAAILVARERHAEAVPLLREAAALKERNPSAPGMTLATLLRDLGRALNFSGAHEEAAAVLRELLTQPDLPLIDRFAASCYLGHNALQRGDVAEALHCAAATLDVAEVLEEKQLIPAYGLAVDARLAADDVAGARVAADRIVELARRVGGPVAQFNSLQDDFEVSLREERLAHAGDVLAELDLRADALDARVGCPEYRDRVEERRTRLADAVARARPGS